MPNDAISKSVAAMTTGVNAPQRIYFIDIYGQTLTQGFDPQTGTWSTGTPLPPPDRDSFSIVAVNDLIYAIGGTIKEKHDTPKPVGTWTFPPLNDGSIFIWYLLSNSTFRYTPFGYTAMAMILPQNNGNYSSGSVPLTFTFNTQVSSVGYSLDNKANVSITGNTTLTGLSNGIHNLTVYANYDKADAYILSSIIFTVTSQAETPLTQTAAIAGVAISVTVIAATALLLYRKKHTLLNKSEATSTGSKN